MRIGILTFHDCTNYGALFQAYALRKIVGRLSDAQTEIIDYKNPRITERLQIEDVMKDRSFKGFVRRMISVPYRRKKNELFEEFLNMNGMLSKRSYDKDTIGECTEQYDILLFGSDQIWNLTLNGKDSTYFGAFASNARKIAYAPSTGGSDLSESTEEIEKWLKGFSALSTRENRDKMLIKQRFGLDAEQVLDPTFLLEREEWIELEEPYVVPERYILL